MPFTKYEFSRFSRIQLTETNGGVWVTKNGSISANSKAKADFLKLPARVVYKVYKIYILLLHIVASTAPQNSTVNAYETS
jgi:hypothetical protein